MDILQIFDCEQGTAEWHKCRADVPTASMFATVQAKGEGKTRTKYMRTIAAQIITGEVIEGYKNAAMERGNLMEAEARDTYSFMKDAEPQRIGFMRRGRAGASPDSLLGDDGLLEIKTKQPDLQIELLEKDKVPPEYKAQIQGQLMISGRQWCDFVSFWPKLPLFVQRVYRDEIYIVELQRAINEFNEELDDLVLKLKGMM